jgi:hypothetical protein
MVEALESNRVIYHYCDANALLSILEHKTLRFTHAAYLNDTSEIQHGVGICRQILEKRLKQSPSDPFLAQSIRYLDNAELWQYYVCCFSECRDSLSQWRAYADNGAGFAIGFSVAYLSQDSDSPFECKLAKVSYDNSALAEALCDFVNDLQSQLTELPGDIDKKMMQLCVENASSRIGGWCIDRSAFHKDVGFIEEEEWRSVRTYRLEGSEEEKLWLDSKNEGLLRRVVQQMQTGLLERRKVRPGRYGLTPYIDVVFQSDAICEIVCGPRTAQKLTETALSILKKKYGLTFVVSRSAASYR